MWIKSRSLKSAQKCPCSNYTLLAQAEVLGLYSDTLVPRSAQPVPDCLQVAFVPPLIPCQRGLMGSWLPSCSPSVRWHHPSHIKNDPIRRRQYVLTGTICSRKQLWLLTVSLSGSHLICLSISLSLSLFPSPLTKTLFFYHSPAYFHSREHECRKSCFILTYLAVSALPDPLPLMQRKVLFEQRFECQSAGGELALTKTIVM